jgi:hypothetical protein
MRFAPGDCLLGAIFQLDGFETVAYDFHWFNVLDTPFFFCNMVCMSAHNF